MSTTITLSAMQLTWIIAGLTEVINTAWWWYVGKRDARGGYMSWDGFFEGVAWLTLTLLIVVTALIATVVLK